MIQRCSNCRFVRDNPNRYGSRCHRYAPRGADSATMAMAEALIAIGWVLAKHHKQTDELGELDAESSPSENYAAFPRVEPDDWCGEWNADA